MSNDTAMKTRFKRRQLSSPGSTQTRRLHLQETGLSEEELDRRAWETANRILPSPITTRSYRGKSK